MLVGWLAGCCLAGWLAAFVDDLVSCDPLSLPLYLIKDIQYLPPKSQFKTASLQNHNNN